MSQQPNHFARDGAAEAAHVRRWRRSQFLNMGFSLHDAQRLTNAQVDLAEMRTLLASGCPRETAKLILL
jgi:hypothetical protein